MAEQLTATKSNLLRLQKTLALAQNGYELLDRKRNILIRETMGMIERAQDIQLRIRNAYGEAYDALRRANLVLGIVDEIAKSVPTDDQLRLSGRSVMGVEIPSVTDSYIPPVAPGGFHRTNMDLDEAYLKFHEARRLTVELAELESGVYRLAEGIRKTQKRANALKNMMIPRYVEQIAVITESLSEKEREEFSRQKVIKKQLEDRNSKSKSKSKADAKANGE